MLIHFIVLIDNQALANIHINIIFIFFSYPDIVSTQKNLVMKGKDHVQFDIKFYFESFYICYADSLMI